MSSRNDSPSQVDTSGLGPQVRLVEVSKAFGAVKALDRFSATIEGGVIVALLGPNGCGKTTLLDVIGGFRSPDAGRVVFSGNDITHYSPASIAKLGFGRTFQDLGLARQASVADHLRAAGLKAIDGLTYGDFGQELSVRLLMETEVDLDRPIGTLSYGQQKMVALACALSTGRNVLLLDEPTAGLHEDVIEPVLELMLRLRGAGKAIVWVEHDLRAIATRADRIIGMDQGRVVAEGTPDSVLDDAKFLTAYFG